MALIEVPGVNSAVQKLEELADRMRTDEFGFRDNDVFNIDKVIDALLELEMERKKIHEELEKETIISSVLRHRLKALPGQIRAEIMDAVMAARQANTNVLREMQDRLKRMTSNIKNLETQTVSLEEENASLRPERVLIKEQYQEAVLQLNQTLAKKAGMQIYLNETRDRVRQSNQTIVDLEDDIMQLKEDLIGERVDARKEKRRIMQNQLDTTARKKDQLEQNLHKQKERDTLREKLTRGEAKLAEVESNLNLQGESVANMKREREMLKEQLVLQYQANDRKRIESTDLMNQRIEEQRNFKERKQEILEQIKQFETDLEETGKKKTELERRRESLQTVFEDKKTTEEENAAILSEVDAGLQEKRNELAGKIQEMAALYQENTELDEQMGEMEESHKAVMAQLTNQIKEFKEGLAHDRKERQAATDQKETVTQELVGLNADLQKFMADIAAQVKEGKKKHQDLSTLGMKLKTLIQEDDAKITEKKSDLETATESYKAMFDSYSEAIAEREKEIKKLEADMAKHRSKIEEKTPGFIRLEKIYTEEVLQYTNLKTAIAELRTRKVNLEAKIQKHQDLKHDLKFSQIELGKQIKDKRSQIFRQMDRVGEVMQAKEEELLTMIQRVNAVNHENKLMEQSHYQLKMQTGDVVIQVEQMNARLDQLERNIAEQKSIFAEKWKDGNIMDKEYMERDEGLITEFGGVVAYTEQREAHLQLIVQQLKEELLKLGGFLDTAGSLPEAGGIPEGRDSPNRGELEEDEKGFPRRRVVARGRIFSWFPTRYTLRSEDGKKIRPPASPRLAMPTEEPVEDKKDLKELANLSARGQPSTAATADLKELANLFARGQPSTAATAEDKLKSPRATMQTDLGVSKVRVNSKPVLPPLSARRPTQHPRLPRLSHLPMPKEI